MWPFIVYIFAWAACSSVVECSVIASSDAQCGTDRCLPKKAAHNAYTWDAESMAEDASVLLQSFSSSVVTTHKAEVDEDAKSMEIELLSEQIHNLQEQLEAKSDVKESRGKSTSSILEGEASAMEAILKGEIHKKDVEVVLARYDEDIMWSLPYKHIRTVYCKNHLNLVPGCSQELPNVGREGHSFLWHIVKNYDNLSKWTVFSQAGDPTVGYKGHRKGGGHMMPGVAFDSFVLPESAGGLRSTDGALFVITSSMHMSNLNHSIRQSYYMGGHDDSSKPMLHLAGTCPKAVFDDRWRPWMHLSWFTSLLGNICGVPQDMVAGKFQRYWDTYIKLPRPKNDVVFFAQGARFAVSAERIRQRPKQDYEDLLELISHDEDPCWNYFNEWVWYYIMGTPKESPCDSELVLQQANQMS